MICCARSTLRKSSSPNAVDISSYRRNNRPGLSEAIEDSLRKVIEDQEIMQIMHYAAAA